MGILQSRILERVAIPFSRGSSDPGIEPGSPASQVDALPLAKNRNSSDTVDYLLSPRYL